MNDLVAQIVPDELVSLRGSFARTAIGIAAVVAVAGLAYASPWASDAVAPWRASPLAAPLAAVTVALAGLTLAPLWMLVALCGFFLGPWTGFAAASSGALLAAAAGYGIGARVRRELVRRWVGRHVERLRRPLEIGGLQAMLVARLLTRAPFGAVSLVAGATRFSLRDFLLGTVCAIAPGTLALVLLGHAMARVSTGSGSGPAAAAVAIALTMVAAMLAIQRQLSIRSGGEGAMS
jgi:uncharacterized membrane protein YdjX (TVP38/TMEM64 family)